MEGGVSFTWTRVDRSRKVKSLDLLVDVMHKCMGLNCLKRAQTRSCFKSQTLKSSAKLQERI